MNPTLRKLLNPMLDLPEEERMALLKRIIETYPAEWKAACFMMDEGYPELASRYLKQQCNTELHNAGRLLDLMHQESLIDDQREMAKAAAPQTNLSITRTNHADQKFSTDSSTTVVNV